MTQLEKGLPPNSVVPQLKFKVEKMKEKVSSVEIISKTPINNIAPCQWYHIGNCSTRRTDKLHFWGGTVGSPVFNWLNNAAEYHGLKWHSERECFPIHSAYRRQDEARAALCIDSSYQTDMPCFQTCHDVREVGKLCSRCAGLALWILSLLNQRLKWEGKGKLIFILLSKKIK